MKKLAFALALLCATAVVVARVAFAAPKATGDGVVIVDTNLAYEGGRAAGTGMVLTSSGEILTNNHVIAGASTITVVVPGTAHRYAARVVGYSVSSDVAVLQLRGAPSLAPAAISTAKVFLGQRVRAVGNAGGTGSLTSAAGRITGVGRTITASDETGDAETLHGMLKTDADVQAGDSGGPLLDAGGRVVGMDTAASRGGYGFASAASPDAYAIPIVRALAVAHRIAAGQASATVHVGGTAFLGVQVQGTPEGGALIAGVVSGGPADAAGLRAGDVITRIAGRAVTQPTDVSAYLLAKQPGQRVAVGYVDVYGGVAGTVRVTLGSGPPK